MILTLVFKFKIAFLEFFKNTGLLLSVLVNLNLSVVC